MNFDFEIMRDDCISELKIPEGIEENSKILFLISQ